MAAKKKPKLNAKRVSSESRQTRKTATATATASLQQIHMHLYPFVATATLRAARLLATFGKSDHWHQWSIPKVFQLNLFRIKLGARQLAPATSSGPQKELQPKFT